jgi:peptidoglycan/xylan/chitin deacetylase (PgdA/CDA1 family)
VRRTRPQADSVAAGTSGRALGPGVFLALALLASVPGPARADAALAGSSAAGSATARADATAGPAAPRKAPARTSAREPLLASVCYHRFGTETRLDPYRISLKRLGAQLDWLRSHGWQGVSLTQVAAALQGVPGALPPKGVLLSVDDGYKAGALGAKVFESHGYRAVYFVYPSVLGAGSFLSWDDLKRLEARGHTVACHSMTHPDLAKVPKGMDPADYGAWIVHELADSKRRLEQGLGHPVTALAWPYGAYNPALSAAARRAGYTQVWSVSGGLNLGRSLEPDRLRRILLMGHPSLSSFKERFAALPVLDACKGVQEGGMVYRSELPLALRLRKGVRAYLGGRQLKAPPDAPGPVLGADLVNGFHYLVLQEDAAGGRRESPLLFQVIPDRWKAHFDALLQKPAR